MTVPLGTTSYYEESAGIRTRYAALEGDTPADVAIIGGGFAGLSAAIELADRGTSVVLLEAGRVGDGASGRNGGQVIHGLACDMPTIEDQMGMTAARQVW